jgi:hypothetical protein
VKQAFVSRGERFVAAALRSVAKISEHGRHFVQDGMVRALSHPATRSHAVIPAVRGASTSRVVEHAHARRPGLLSVGRPPSPIHGPSPWL